MAQPIYNKNNKKAFSIFLAIMIMGAVGLVVVLAMSIISISSSRITKNFENSNKAENLANSCANLALVEVRNNENFTGTGEFTEGDFKCDYLVNNLGGDEREIQAWSEVNNVYKKILINIDVTYPKLTINSWEEVDAF